MESGENQNPTLDTLKKVAKALGVSIEELIK
jgi:transcriptional regulator with XRE-family HTH domain